MFPAKNGDTFLVSCFGESNVNILIDLAYLHTYKNYVKPVLLDKNTTGESLDLMVVTHIDQDHIAGAISFLKDNGSCESPNIIEVKEIWHNSYRHLSISQHEHQLNKTEKEMIEKKVGYVERDYDDCRTPISGKQGSRLAGYLYLNGYNWNGSYNDNAVSYNEIPVFIGNGSVKLTVLSPTNIELNNLEKVWRKELRRTFPRMSLTSDPCFDDAVEYVSEYLEPKGVGVGRTNVSATGSIKKLSMSPFAEDRDEINASSITFILEHRDKKMLFLGDCPPSITIRQLEALFSTTEVPLYFDLIKVSHHGSQFNTNMDLLNMIDSKNYLISTNGSGHGHPDMETLSRIVDRKSTFTRNLFFSYPTPSAISMNKEDLKKEFNYEVFYPSTEESVIVHL
ncbi:beta-lactamase superfamily II metal-dependent hydrolase [Paenibacillus sp. PastF-3]|uniref:MBL fold metallo-hydrolase n=1 Tax=Paenibacillus sp. PastF-3 TaxID=2940626 RepID=UPI002476DC24|nr:MBL fold metallo-hydrolase [Paenibacillus sp. PastF-3]MDH6372518.1 beta-lactamase superfamily II metal-dependent hydrolase [Paenibacillus sp. PastF-3]